jgi:DNA-binding MarR family transcriptional regulator
LTNINTRTSARRQVGREKSMVSRALAALAQEELVERDPDVYDHRRS